jgi:hypothetical protein
MRVTKKDNCLCFLNYLAFLRPAADRAVSILPWVYSPRGALTSSPSINFHKMRWVHKWSHMKSVEVTHMWTSSTLAFCRPRKFEVSQKSTWPQAPGGNSFHNTQYIGDFNTYFIEINLILNPQPVSDGPIFKALQPLLVVLNAQVRKLQDIRYGDTWRVTDSPALFYIPSCLFEHKKKNLPRPLNATSAKCSKRTSVVNKR